MTFHHRVAEARAFAQAVPQASAHLWGEKQAVYPQRVWSGWLYGGHQMAHRRQVLAQFARGWDTDGVVAARCVLSSARVLAEGVGIPEVDAVVFADPRKSIVDTAQTAGRALRQSPQHGTRGISHFPGSRLGAAVGGFEVGRRPAGGVEAVGGHPAAQRFRLADVQAVRGEHGVHDLLVQARLAAATAQDESKVTAGFGEQVSAVEAAAAVHHEHRRGDVDGRKGGRRQRQRPGPGSLPLRRGRARGGS